MNRIAILVLLTAVAGCQKTSTTIAQPNEEQTPSPTVIGEATKAKAIAAKEEMFKQLSGRLMEVMKSDGPGAAIEVCSKEALQFATQVGEQQGVKIGRTALKLRNPTNSPPTWASNLATDTATEPQFVSVDDHTVGALLPIKLQQKCLTCHGESETLAPPVKEQLAKFYPNDTATGFKEGDLRGWFWVEVPVAGDGPAKPAANDQARLQPSILR